MSATHSPRGVRGQQSVFYGCERERVVNLDLLITIWSEDPPGPAFGNVP